MKGLVVLYTTPALGLCNFTSRRFVEAPSRVAPNTYRNNMPVSAFLFRVVWSTFNFTYFKTTHFKPAYSLPERIVELVTSHLMTGKLGVGKLQLAE